jgi:hypothetical protein
MANFTFLRAAILALLVTSLHASETHPGAALLPADRLSDWRAGVSVGVPGGIPANRTNLIDVTQTPYSADNTGANDAQPAIMKALAKAGENDVVYLPAGTYRVNTPVTINKSRVTLRGAGPDKTIVMAYNSGRGGAIDVNFLTAKAGFWDGKNRMVRVVGSPAKGATVLNLADTKVLANMPKGGTGQICQLSLKNDPKLPVIASGGGEYLRKQVTRIVSKTETSVTIAPPLQFDLPDALEPMLLCSDFQVEGVGIEDLSINGSNSKTRHAPLMMGQSYGCWFKNVSVVNVPNYHIWMLETLQCEIRHCFASKRTVKMGPDGAGILVTGCSNALIEDNLLVELFPHIEVNTTSGSVIAYNYCDDTGIQSSLLGCSINSNHSAHNSYNLYEGNYAPRFQSDGYHGSASHDTAFRNWFHGSSSTAKEFWVCVNLNRFTRYYSLVGNVLGKKGINWSYEKPDGFGYNDHLIYAFGFPGMGNGGFKGQAQPSQGKAWADWDNYQKTGKGPGAGGYQELDLDVKATTLLKANYNFKDNGVPQNESVSGTLPKSLYLTAKPAWFGDQSWPSYGPDVDFEKSKIPAQVRFEALAK